MDDELKIGDLVSCKYWNGVIGQVAKIEDDYVTVNLVTPISTIGGPLKAFSKIKYYEN